MGSLNNIAAKALVWLAALLIPAETMPLAGCACGSNPGKLAPGSTSGCKQKGPAASCPHCQAKLKSESACCKARGVEAASHSAGGCCGTKATCCCSKGTATKGLECLCSASHPVPTPAPVPNDSPSDSAKSLTASVVATVLAGVALPGVQSRAVEPSSLSGKTSLERLSTLGRLVI